MRTTHLIILTMAAVSLMGCNPKETVNALTSDLRLTYLISRECSGNRQWFFPILFPA